MSRMRAGWLAVAVVAVLGSACSREEEHARPADGAKKTSGAGTSRELLQKMLACRSAGDRVGWAQFVAEPIGSKLRAHLAAEKSVWDARFAQGRLADAIDAKFGDGTAARDFDLGFKGVGGPAAAAAGPAAEIIDVKEEGDRATARIKPAPGEAEEVLHLAKVGGVWFLDLKDDLEAVTGLSERDISNVKENGRACDAAAKFVADMDRLAKDVAGGAVASKEDAKARLKGIVAAMERAMAGDQMGGGKAPAAASEVAAAKAAKARADLKSIAGAIELFHNDSMRYPETLDALVGEYLREKPLDPWGRPYVYELTGGEPRYSIGPYGADGKRGGVGEDADIFRPERK